MFHKQNGNALLYVLIAVALLAVLTYTIAGENRGQQQNQLSESRTKLLASDLISHANSAEIAFKQMEMFGVEADQVLFDLPGTTDYSTNVTRQIYHPSGGGLAVFSNLEKYTTPGGAIRGWTWKKSSNIEWTSTTQTDLSFNFGNIDENICAEINQQLLGNPQVLITDDNFNFRFHFDENAAGHHDFVNSECTDCINKSAACIKRNDNVLNAYTTFYKIIKPR